MGWLFCKNAERGNIATVLFGSVAMVGVISAATMQMISGPIKTASQVNNKNMVESQLVVGARILVIDNNATDVDADGTIEPVEHNGVNIGLTGGGGIPNGVGASKTDPWNNPYGYCVWDNGIDSTAAGNRLNGENSTDALAIALISAGPNRTFETSCTAGPGGAVNKPVGSDDFVYSYTYAEAVSVAGGLWQTGSGNPNDEVVVKDSGGTETVTVDKEQGIGTFNALVTDLIMNKTGNGFNIDVGRGNVYIEENGNDNADGAGLTLRTSSNPATGAMFSVRSSGNGTRLWVGQNVTSSGINPFYVGSSGAANEMHDTSQYPTKIDGTGNSYFGGNVGISGNTSPYRNLTVRGPGITSGEHRVIGVETPNGNESLSLGYTANGTIHTQGFLRTNNGLPLLLGTNGSTDALTILNNGNVGIGDTNPTSVLSLTGDLRFQGDGMNDLDKAGTSESNRIFRSADTDLPSGSLYGSLVFENTDGNSPEPDGDFLWVNTGNDGVPSFDMILNGQGNLGLGTVPGASYRLDVNGTSRFIGNMTVDGSINSTGAAGGLVAQPRDGTGANWVMYNPTGDNLRFWNTSNNDVAILDNDGNLTLDGGLTTTSMSINNGTNFNPASNVNAALVPSGSFGGGLVFNDTNYAGVWTTTNGTELQFDVNGSAGGFGSGVGAMTLEQTQLNFDNKEAIRFSDNWLRLNQSSDFPNGVFTPGNVRVDGLFTLANNTPTIYFQEKTAGQESFWIHNNADRLYFLGDGGSGSGSWDANRPLVIHQGNVGISEVTPSYNLDVSGNARITGSLYLTSDINKKENVSPLTNALDHVSKLQGVSYTWKAEFQKDDEDSKKTQYGLIAQEVEAVYPEIVSEDNEGYKAVNYSALIGPMIEAIKELKAENEALSKRIEELEQK